MWHGTVSTDPSGRLAAAVLRCPRCHSELVPGGTGADDVDRVRCVSCESTWPVRWGIPDLRLPGTSDPYLSLDEDLRAADRLANQAERTDFASLLASYYETNARVPASQARRFSSGALAACGRADAVLAQWSSMARGAPGAGALLVDDGCGTGPLAVAAVAAGYRVVGVDVGLRWLVLAGVRAREAGVHVTLACASATALPLATAGTDIVAMESLLENVVPSGAVVAEAARVLAAGGRFWCTTANRWSVGPDPHLGLPWSGWWPDGAAARYARWRGQVPPVRRLLGARDVRRLLAAHGLGHVAIEPAVIAASQREAASGALRLAVDAYGLASATAIGRMFLAAAGPSLVVTAVRDQSHPAAS